MHRLLKEWGSLCRVLIKVHVLTGNEVISRIGTKPATMWCNRIIYLTEFAERGELLEAEIMLVEEYVVRGWAGARS